MSQIGGTSTRSHENARTNGDVSATVFIPDVELCMLEFEIAMIDCPS
jgi:hypothetical protein